MVIQQSQCNAFILTQQISTFSNFENLVKESYRNSLPGIEIRGADNNDTDIKQQNNPDGKKSFDLTFCSKGLHTCNLNIRHIILNLDEMTNRYG